MAFKFIHTADVHLDSPLRSLALRDSKLSDLIGTATRTVFRNIIQLCLDEQVDALLIAGDFYDNTQSSIKTALFLTNELRRLQAAGIQVYMIRGNHDAGSKITGELVLPENVKVFRGWAEAVEVKRQEYERQVFVHGISFSGTSADQSLLPKFKEPIAGAINIGLLHTSLNGAKGHDPYAPCSVADLHQMGFDYWALGHVHKRAVHEGQCVIVMPGMPQGRDIGEAGQKSVTLVSISDDKKVTIEERPTSFAQFERIEIDISSIKEWSGLARQVERRLAAARAGIAANHLLARVELTGSTTLYWQVRRDQDELRTQFSDSAAMLENCWIDKIEIHCDPPLEEASNSNNPLSELRRLIAEKVVPGGNFQMDAESLATDFRSQLPNDCRSFLPSDQEALQIALGVLTKDGIEDVLAQLQSSTESE